MYIMGCQKSCESMERALNYLNMYSLFFLSSLYNSTGGSFARAIWRKGWYVECRRDNLSTPLGWFTIYGEDSERTVSEYCQRWVCLVLDSFFRTIFRRKLNVLTETLYTKASLASPKNHGLLCPKKLKTYFVSFSSPYPPSGLLPRRPWGVNGWSDRATGTNATA